MMISPESKKECLETKSDKEILLEIRKLKRQISQLKKQLESDVTCEPKIIMSPSPEVQISVFYEYIEEAKQLLLERGVEYVPTKSEQRSLEFNDRLPNLLKIEVKRDRFAYLSVRYVIICGEKFLTRNSYAMRPDPEEQFDSWIIPIDKTRFLSDLEKLHVGEWKRHYYTPALDGEQWEITFKYNDGTQCGFDGSNAYPYNFNNLMELLGIAEDEEIE